MQTCHTFLGWQRTCSCDSTPIHVALTSVSFRVAHSGTARSPENADSKPAEVAKGSLLLRCTGLKAQACMGASMGSLGAAYDIIFVKLKESENRAWCHIYGTTVSLKPAGERVRGLGARKRLHAEPHDRQCAPSHRLQVPQQVPHALGTLILPYDLQHAPPYCFTCPDDGCMHTVKFMSYMMLLDLMPGRILRSQCASLSTVLHALVPY